MTTRTWTNDPAPRACGVHPSGALASVCRPGRDSPGRGGGVRSGAYHAAWVRRLTLAAVVALGLTLASLAVAAPTDAEPPHVPIPGGLAGKTCYECHVVGSGVTLASRERPRRYSLAGAFETYLESPHGRLRRLGDQRAPMCEDCHFTREWSEILPQEHPDSPINPRNLPNVCARCHGEVMRTANVAAGSMHLELSHRSLMPGTPLDVRYGFLPGLTKAERHYYIGPIDVTAYVSVFFLLITVGTLVGFASYMVVDLIRKLIERKTAPEAAESEHERSDP